MGKNILIFLSGMLTAFIAILIAPIVINVAIPMFTHTADEGGYPGLTLFKEAEGNIDVQYINISEVLEPNIALAKAGNKPNVRWDIDSLTVLLIGDETSNYYDNEKIKVPQEKKVKHIGTYKNYQGTLPAVRIE